MSRDLLRKSQEALCARLLQRGPFSFEFFIIEPGRLKILGM